jgi:hypothetical protein
MNVSCLLHVQVAVGGEKNRYPLVRILGGPQNRAGRRDEKNNSCLCRESNPGSPARGLITIPTEVSWLLNVIRWIKTNTELQISVFLIILGVLFQCEFGS